jgi:hypothetical protein
MLEKRLSTIRQSVLQIFQRFRKNKKREAKESQSDRQDSSPGQESTFDKIKSIPGSILQQLRTDPRVQVVLAAGLVLVFFVFFAVISLVAWHELIQFEYKSSTYRDDVLLLASYPRFLSTGDQGSVIVTVVNAGQIPITDTTVVLTCDNVKYISMDVDSSNLIRFGHLAPSERKTKLVTFQVNPIDSRERKLDADLHLLARDGVTMTSTITNALHIEPTIISFLPPVDVSSLVLNRTVTVPKLFVALGAILVSARFVMEVIKVFQEISNSDSKRSSAS